MPVRLMVGDRPHLGSAGFGRGAQVVQSCISGGRERQRVPQAMKIPDQIDRSGLCLTVGEEQGGKNVAIDGSPRTIIC